MKMYEELDSFHQVDIDENATTLKLSELRETIERIHQKYPTYAYELPEKFKTPKKAKQKSEDQVKEFKRVFGKTFLDNSLERSAKA